MSVSIEPIAHALVEGLELVVAEHVVERQHRFRVSDLAKGLELGGTDALRRRVRSHELGVLALDLLAAVA